MSGQHDLNKLLLRLSSPAPSISMETTQRALWAVFFFPTGPVSRCSHVHLADGARRHRILCNKGKASEAVPESKSSLQGLEGDLTCK